MFKPLPDPTTAEEGNGSDESGLCMQDKLFGIEELADENDVSYIKVFNGLIANIRQKLQWLEVMLFESLLLLDRGQIVLKEVNLNNMCNLFSIGSNCNKIPKKDLLKLIF